MARKAGVPLSDAERYWREAKVSADEQGFVEGDDDFYSYVMGIVKRRMGMSSGLLTVAGSLDVAEARKVRKTFTIEAEASTMGRLERFLALAQYNGSVGHSSFIGMHMDGDGADSLTVTAKGFGWRLSNWRGGLEKVTGVGYDVEMATDYGYSGLNVDRDRESKHRYTDDGKERE